MHFDLPPLPYREDDLAPHVSAETLRLHHGKHHAAYVEKLNALVAGTKHADRPLEELIEKMEGPIFDNAAQHWNHSFYWHCMSPRGGGEPGGALAQALASTWGSFAAFRQAFDEAAVGHFGSGWAWLVERKGKLEIVTTHDAGNPQTNGRRPVLTCDVWEHAYYVDHRNDRHAYLDSWWKVVDWGFAAKNLGEPWAIAKAARGGL